MTTERKHTLLKIAVNVCSLSIAAIFIFSGFTKAVDPMGGALKITEYLNAFGFEISYGIIPVTLSMLQSIVEFMLGIYLLLGMRRRMTTLALTIIMIAMTLLTLYISKTDVVTNCGCFGDAINLSNRDTLIKNLVITTASFFITFKHDNIIAYMRRKSEWTAKTYAILFVASVNFYAFHYLPPVDFRPFYIGQDIVKAMNIPDNAKPPVYKVTFILKKDGKEKQFSLADYPDSTWEYVDTKTELVQAGYHPEITDFDLFDIETDENVTNIVLGNKKYAFWIVMPYIEMTDTGVLDAIGDIYDYCKLQNYDICGLTSSDVRQVQEWKHLAGIDIPFYWSDDVTLKTMIRSNPGLLLVRNANILNKWSKNNFPDDEILTEPLEKLTANYGTGINGLKGAFKFLAIFVIPLIFLIFADKYRSKNRRAAGKKGLSPTKFEQQTKTE